MRFGKCTIFYSYTRPRGRLILARKPFSFRLPRGWVWTWISSKMTSVPTEVEARVLADVTRAREMRLDGVPTFFVNGQRIAIPRSLEEFEDVILAAVEEGRSG